MKGGTTRWREKAFITIFCIKFNIYLESRRAAKYPNFFLYSSTQKHQTFSDCILLFFFILTFGNHFFLGSIGFELPGRFTAHSTKPPLFLAIVAPTQQHRHTTKRKN